MNDAESQPRDEADNLSRALAAIERQASEQNASDEILAGTLVRMKHAAEVKPAKIQKLFRKMTTMTFTQKIAAAFMLTLGGIVLWFVFSLFGGFANVTYAEVADQIRAARTVSWTATVSGGLIPAPMTMKTLCIEPDRVRTEFPGGMGVVIMDRASGKSLMLNAMDKTARSIQIQTNGKPTPMQDTQAYFLNLAQQQGTPLEDRQIGDIKAKGFKTTSFGCPTSLWVDPKTRLPLLVETSVTAGNQQMKVVMSDFVFDAPLDPSLFSLDPPAGYTMTEMHPMTVVVDIEANVTTLLRYCAAHSYGNFPPSLTDIASFSKMVAGASRNNQLEGDAQNAMSAAGGLMGTLFSMKEGVDYGYTPQGARLGDADKRIFWYRVKGTLTYRAIYGDLHAADIQAADIPLTQPSGEPGASIPTSPAPSAP